MAIVKQERFEPGPDFTEQQEQGLLLVAEAEDLKVIDQATFEQAAEMLKSIKAYLAEVKRITAPVVTAAHGAWKAALAQQQGLEANALEAERILKKALGEYEAAQRAEAEKVRREAERIQREAEAIAKAKAKEAGTALQPIIVFTPPPPPVPKAQGVAFRTNWKAEVIDLDALIRAVADGKAAKNVLAPDMTVLNGLAKSLKGELGIPGVRAISERIVSA